MSHVLLIAADRALPLCDCGEFREHEAGGIAVGFPCGFQVSEHRYYREAADMLGFVMKPFQYELSLECCRTDLDHLLDYLRENLLPGESVELWSLWVGDGGETRPIRYRGNLSGFDLDTLGMLTEIQYEPDLTGEFPNGLISQICVTIDA